MHQPVFPNTRRGSEIEFTNSVRLPEQRWADSVGTSFNTTCHCWMEEDAGPMENRWLSIEIYFEQFRLLHTRSHRSVVEGGSGRVLFEWSQPVEWAEEEEEQFTSIITKEWLKSNDDTWKRGDLYSCSDSCFGIKIHQNDSYYDYYWHNYYN